MQIGARVKKHRWHPLRALWNWLHDEPRDAGRKCLHGQYPACNWYPPTMPETKKEPPAAKGNG